MEAEEEGPVITALGSLFKLTEVYLWDDGRRKTLGAELSNSDIEVEDAVADIECRTMLEDRELAEQMNSLGLPLSFHTNKEKRNGTAVGKRKATPKKPCRSSRDFVDKTPEFLQVSEDEIITPVTCNDDTQSSLCCTSMLGQSELSFCDVSVDAYGSQHSPGEGDDSENSTGITCNGSGGLICDGSFDNAATNGEKYGSKLCYTVLQDDMKTVSSSVCSETVLSQESNVTDLDYGHDEREVIERVMENEYLEGLSMPEHKTAAENISDHNSTQQHMDAESVGIYAGHSGDWTVYWDSFYLRNYFYNCRAHESTWYPPPGLEHFSTGGVNCELNEQVIGETENDVCPGVKANDTCLMLEESNLYVSSIDSDKSIDLPRGLSLGTGLTAINSLSGDTVHMVSGCPGLFDESQNIKKTCCVLKEHASSFGYSCIDKQFSNEKACSEFTERIDDQDSFDLLKETNSVISLERNLDFNDHDKSSLVLNTEELILRILKFVLATEYLQWITWLSSMVPPHRKKKRNQEHGHAESFLVELKRFNFKRYLMSIQQALKNIGVRGIYYSPDLMMA